MKNLLVVVLGLSGLASCGSSQQQSAKLNSENYRFISRIYTELTDVSMDPSLPRATQGANLSVNFGEKKVVISVPNCPVGAKCIWAGPVYSADLISDTTDNCQVRTIKAMTDGRPVDGALTEIEITDYSNNQCDNIRPAFKIVAKLHTAVVSRTDGKQYETYSELRGNSAFASSKF